MSIVWTADNEYEEFLVSDLERCSKYKSLLRKTNAEMLARLADALTLAAQETSCSRWNLFISAGQCLKDRMAAYVDVLHHELGDPGTIVDYKVVGVNTKQFERGGIAAMIAALCFPLPPSVWIKFGLL